MPGQTHRDQLAELIDDDITRQVQVHGLYISEGPYQGEIADAILKAGWRPPARVITTVAELDALPIGSVILLEYGVVAQAVGGEEDINATGWMGIGHDLQWTSAQVVEHAGQGASFAVLYVPENGDTE